MEPIYKGLFGQEIGWRLKLWDVSRSCGPWAAVGEVAGRPVSRRQLFSFVGCLKSSSRSRCAFYRERPAAGWISFPSVCLVAREKYLKAVSATKTSAEEAGKGLVCS